MSNGDMSLVQAHRSKIETSTEWWVKDDDRVWMQWDVVLKKIYPLNFHYFDGERVNISANHLPV